MTPGLWVCHICGKKGLRGTHGFNAHYMSTHWEEPPWEEVVRS